MGQLTNKKNLPDAIYRAVANDPYNPGDCDITVTKLIAPPQLVTLAKKHSGDIIEDVEDRIWSLLGQAVHTILERAEGKHGVITEHRLFAPVNDWWLGGAFDRYEDGVLQDYKVTSVYSVMKGKDDWVKQLNCLAWLARRNDMKVKKLQIVAILRDWHKRDADRNKDYPQSMVQVIDILLWPMRDQEAYVRERILLHKRAQIDHSVPECTPEERWHQPQQFAVMKRNTKKAIKLFNNIHEAEAHIVRLGAREHFVESRPGEYRRCTSYCPVSEFCPQWKKDKPQF